MSLEDIFEPEEPRPHRLWAVIGVMVPVGIFAGVAAWFIRSYVVPPMVAMSEPVAVVAPQPTPTLASTDATPAPQPPTETMGAAPATEALEPTPPPPIFATLAFAPLHVPLSQTTDSAAAPEPAVAPAADNGEPATEPVPMPRPRASAATTGVAVPLPRPRP